LDIEDLNVKHFVNLEHPEKIKFLNAPDSFADQNTMSQFYTISSGHAEMNHREFDIPNTSNQSETYDQGSNIDINNKISSFLKIKKGNETMIL
jgi:hypothetical protein